MKFCKRVQSGFTLVELLVVIAIIGVLVATLLPSLSAAKDQVRLLICQTRLRGIATGIYMYIDQNHRYYPYAEQYPGKWYVPIQPYMGEDPKILRCPCAVEVTVDPPILTNQFRTGGYYGTGTSYACQGYGGGAGSTGPAGWSGWQMRLDGPKQAIRVHTVDNATGAIQDPGLFGSSAPQHMYPFQDNPYIVESGYPFDNYAGFMEFERHPGYVVNYISVSLAVMRADFSQAPRAVRTNDGSQEWARVTSNVAVVGPGGLTMGMLSDWPYTTLRQATPGLVP